jgi:hypothetical protein
MSSEWTATNYPLRPGEFGYEIDTGKLKVGDGLRPWLDLPYFIDEDIIASILASTGGQNADPRIGAMVDLTTTTKATVVGAINEVNNPLVELPLLYENAKAG